MKFIFPQNYSFEQKLFGIIRYSTLIVNLIWDVFVFCFINLIFSHFSIKVFLFIILCLPLLLISMITFQQENIVQVFIYFFKYLKFPKLYLYRKY